MDIYIIHILIDIDKKMLEGAIAWHDEPMMICIRNMICRQTR